MAAGGAGEGAIALGRDRLSCSVAGEKGTQNQSGGWHTLVFVGMSLLKNRHADNMRNSLYHICPEQSRVAQTTAAVVCVYQAREIFGAVFSQGRCSIFERGCRSLLLLHNTDNSLSGSCYPAGKL